MSNLPKTKKKKEIVVTTPMLIRKKHGSLEVGPIAEKTNFFNICTKIRGCVAWPIMVVSLILFLWTTYGILNPAEISLSKPLLFGAMFSIGTMNIFSGLLLLARE